jgi:hypothetical protein
MDPVRAGRSTDPLVFGALALLALTRLMTPAASLRTVGHIAEAGREIVGE